jgi:protein-tyrosine phosphatase
MKILINICLIFFSASIFALEGYKLPNSHWVDFDQRILRSKEPTKYVSELVDLKIKHVIIFKDSTLDDVDREIEALLKANYKPENIHHIPARWRDIKSPQIACEQFIKALTIIREVKYTTNDKMLFHCTLGEDRTGSLTALWKMMDLNANLDEVFEQDMCAHGYEAGNPKKPEFINRIIRAELTPIVMMMATFIENNIISRENLDSSICLDAEKYMAAARARAKKYSCRK